MTGKPEDVEWLPVCRRSTQNGKSVPDRSRSDLDLVSPTETQRTLKANLAINELRLSTKTRD